MLSRGLRKKWEAIVVLSFLKMHPAIKLNKFYPFKKIRTVEPQSREER